MTEGRTTTKAVKLTPRAHSRLKDACRGDETLSGAVERALDALDREDDLPDAVSEAMGDSLEQGDV